MNKTKKISVRRTKRTDAIILLRQKYEGTIDANPQTYNRAFADILRKMADAIADVKNARVDPEVLVWMHRPGEVTAEVTLSPIA
jgi:putative heme iron utilization protein